MSTTDTDVWEAQGECYACMVGVATGPESHTRGCSARNVPMPEQDAPLNEWALHRHQVAKVKAVAWERFVQAADDVTCTCRPCTTPGYGAPGYDHCAACCYGTLIEEYDLRCPSPKHRDMARRQFPEVTGRAPVPVGFDDEPPF